MNRPARERQERRSSRHHPENRAPRPSSQPPQQQNQKPKPNRWNRPPTWIAATAAALTAIITWALTVLACKAVESAWNALTPSEINITDNCQLIATIIAILTGLIAGAITLWIAPAFFPED